MVLHAENSYLDTVELNLTDLGRTDIVSWPERMLVYHNYLATAENSVQPTRFSGPLRCRISRVMLYVLYVNTNYVAGVTQYVIGCIY